MFDPVSSGMRAIAMHSSAAPALAALCGLCSSIGPCVASRFVAVAGLAASHDRRSAFGIAAAFIVGVTAAYMCFGVSVSLLARLASLSHAIYLMVAVTLCAGGVATLWRENTACAHDCEHRERRVSFGGAFTLGVSSAFVASPCCTPVLMGILATTSQAGDAVYGALLVGAFAAGHCLPVLAAGLGASVAGSTLGRAATGTATVVGGTLMLALAGYYAVLA